MDRGRCCCCCWPAEEKRIGKENKLKIVYSSNSPVTLSSGWVDWVWLVGGWSDVRRVQTQNSQSPLKEKEKKKKKEQQKHISSTYIRQRPSWLLKLFSFK